jgi:hypothetical protein
VKRTELGEIILETATSDGTPFCLDKSGGTGNEVKPHLWKCNDEYSNQHWNVEPVEDEYVLLSIKTADFCLDSTGVKEPGVHPHQWACNRTEHNQHWRLVFSQ